MKRCVQKETGTQYAAKIINKRRLTARGMRTLQQTHARTKYFVYKMIDVLVYAWWITVYVC